MPSGSLSPLTLFADRLRRVGLFGTYLFSSFALLGITPATVGLVLLALAFVIVFRDWRTLGRDPLALTAAGFGIFVAIHSLSAYLTAPVEALAEAAAEAGMDWVKLLLFVPFAYWAGGKPERVRLLLFLALLGFAVGALREVDWAQIDPSFFSTRFEAYLPAIALGMFTSLGALGLMAMRERFWHPGFGGTPPWLRLILWLLLLALMLEGLILSYSRGSWLAFAVAAVFLTYLEWRRRDPVAPARPARRGVRIAAAAALAMTLAMVIALQYERIGERLLWERDTFEKMVDGDFDAVPSTSTGLRVQALRFAAELWSQRPWFGWGAGSSPYLVAHSGRAQLMMDGRIWLSHLHNTYAEILVQLGIVGFAFVVALVWLLVRGGTLSCRSAQMSGDLCRFFSASLLFMLIWNLTSYRVLRHDYSCFWIVFAGAVYSFRLRALLEDGGGVPQARSSGIGA